MQKMTVSVFVCLHLCFFVLFVLFVLFCYNSQNFLKNLFKINTLPFLTMLCLFSVFDFGNWEILKNQGVISFLVVVWLQFPKSGKGGQGCTRKKCSGQKMHAQKMQPMQMQAEIGRSAWEIGKCIYIYIIFIIISY